MWLVAALAGVAAVTLLTFGVWAGFSDANRGVSPPHSQPDLAQSGAVGAIGTGQAATSATGIAQSPLLQPKTGDCLLRNGGPQDGEIVVVSCAEAHHMEVVGLVDPTAVIGGEPTQAEWRGLLEAQCENLLAVHLGRLWDPQGRFQSRIAAPGPSEWLQGDRIGECLVILRSGEDAELPRDVVDDAVMALFRGALRDLDLARQYPPGRCLAQGPLVGAPPTPVACEGPHHFQVLQTLDLSTRFPHAPDESQWALLDQECAGQIQAQVSRSTISPPANPLVGSTVRISVRSWLAGSRQSGCLVGEVDATSGQLVERTSGLMS